MGKVLFMRKGETHTAPGVGLPSGYTKLSYIESTRTQRLDTGITEPFELTLDIQFTGVGTDHIMGLSASGGCYFGVNASGYYDVGGRGTIDVSATVRREVVVTFTSSALTISVAGQSKTVSKSAQSSTLKLFGIPSYHANCRIYSAKMVVNNILVRDYIPCINPSGAIGLYDTVTKAFFGNAGTGVFIGSEVA